MAECVLCEAGYFGKGNTSPCEACDDGEISSEGRGSCSKCAEGEYADETHTFCAPCVHRQEDTRVQVSSMKVLPPPWMHVV